jgi:hypothetical protein
MWSSLYSVTMWYFWNTYGLVYIHQILFCICLVYDLVDIYFTHGICCFKTVWRLGRWVCSFLLRLQFLWIESNLHKSVKLNLKNSHVYWIKFAQISEIEPEKYSCIKDDYIVYEGMHHWCKINTHYWNHQHMIPTGWMDVPNMISVSVFCSNLVLTYKEWFATSFSVV